MAIVLTACTGEECALPFSAPPNPEDAAYDDAVRLFTTVSVAEVMQMQQAEDIFYLYTGRKNCPYCQQFVCGLSPLAAQKKITIYYLDSVDVYENSSQELKDFRDTYSISTVPSLILFQGDTAAANLADNLPNQNDEDIIRFLQRYQSLG